MRILTAAISCLLVVLSATLGVCDEPAKKSDISFVVPNPCVAWLYKDECKGLCLGGSYEAGLDVVLLGKAGISRTKTASTCTYRYSSRPAETLTQLADTEKYVKSSGRLLLEHANVALVGVDPAKVRQVPLNPDTSPLPDKMEQEARRLAGFSPGAHNPNERAQERGYGTIFESSPTIILRAGNATLLSFEPKNRSPGEHGLLVLFINDKGYRLPGEGTAIYPFFFTVKDKLYLAYNIPWVTLHTLVYDLSGETLKGVFPPDLSR
jgi:hypothetical protein